MEKKSRKSIIIGITSLFLVMLLLVGLTYAYYRTRIIGNDSTDPSISVQSKKMEITYEDGSATMNMTGKIEPGFEATKTFSVKNTGTESAVFSVVIDNVVNTFNKGVASRGEYNDWEYVLTQDGIEVKKGEITTESKQLILNDVTIASNTTTNFSLKIIYKTLEDVDQSEDMGSRLSIRVNIDEKIVGWDAAKAGTLLYAIKNNELPNINNSSLNVYESKIDNDCSIDSGCVNINESFYVAYSTEYIIQDDNSFSLVNPKIVKFSEIIDIVNNQNKIVYVSSINGSSNNSNVVTSNLISIYKFTSFFIETDESMPDYGWIYGFANELTVGGMFFTEDDYGTSYYYRGKVENNYVNFSGMCWRVVRVQGDGVIKLALADEYNECNSSEYRDFPGIENIGWGINVEYNAISEVVNNWKEKLNDSNLTATDWCYDNSIYSDNSYCMDGVFSTEDECYESGNDWHNIYNYSFSSRINNPTLKCNIKGLNDSKATKFKSKIGLLTADEVVFSGISSNSSSTTSYLISDTAYWLMTPNSVFDIDRQVYFVSNQLTSGSMSENYAVRPAIAIKSDAMLNTSISGQNGTQTNPYVIS